MKRWIELRSRYLCLLLSIVCLHSSAQQIGPHVNHPIAPHTSQVIDLLLAGQSSSDKIFLTLNNNRPDSLPVAFTVYTTNGIPIQLKSMSLDAGESRLLDLAAMLNEKSVHAPLGYMRISYDGSLMELGAQLTLYPIWGLPGLDSPRSLKTDFVSTKRSSVAWQPAEGKAIVAVTNVSNQMIFVKMVTNGRRDTILLGPHETSINVHAVHSDRPLNVDTDYDGPVDAIRSYGYIKSETFGSQPIRFYDIAASTQKILTAPGILSSARQTIPLVRNITNAPVTVVPHVVEAGSMQPTHIDGRPIVIASNDTVQIPIADILSQFHSRSIDRVTVSVQTDATKGALVASMTQVISDKLLEDVPFRTGNAERFMRGAYPLRWEKDYKNLAFIANSSGIDQTIRPIVIAGGVNYALPLTTIKADATAIFDIDSLRANQVPDSLGKTIPLWAKMGKFHWNPDLIGGKNTVVGLMGRMEVLSYQDQRASSFSCGILCDYQYIDGPYFTANPAGTYPGPFFPGARNFIATGDYYDAYGNMTVTGYNSGSFGIFVNDPSIIQMNPADSITMNGDSFNPGNTLVNWYEDHYYSYHYDDTLCVYDNNPNYIEQTGYVPPVGGAQTAPLIGSSCPTGNGLATAAWGVFGVCALSDNYYVKSSGDSCIDVAGPPSNPDTRHCVLRRYSVPTSQSPTGYLCQNVCPVDQRIINNTCTAFADGKSVLYTAGTTYPCN